MQNHMILQDFEGFWQIENLHTYYIFQKLTRFVIMTQFHKYIKDQFLSRLFSIIMIAKEKLTSSL